MQVGGRVGEQMGGQCTVLPCVGIGGLLSGLLGRVQGLHHIAALAGRQHVCTLSSCTPLLL